jgi:hypothetical protein
METKPGIDASIDDLCRPKGSSLSTHIGIGPKWEDRNKRGLAATKGAGDRAVGRGI